MKDFGIIIACYRGDYHLLQGLCASIRYFMSEVPICLLVDGDFSIEPLKKTYNTTEMRKCSVQDPILQSCFGGPFTKMVSLCEAPWPYYLYLDADCIVLGNILKLVEFERYDFIYDRPLATYSDGDIDRWFFQTAQMTLHFPNFDWRADRDKFFNSGVWFGRRAAISTHRLHSILEFYRHHPDMFFFDQGVLNYLLFSGEQEGELRLAGTELQLMVPNWKEQVLDDWFDRLVINGTGQFYSQMTFTDSRVVHWCGPKPVLADQTVYSRPMDFFRRRAQLEALGRSRLAAELALHSEDFRNVHSRQISAKWRHQVARVKRRLRGVLLGQV